MWWSSGSLPTGRQIVAAALSDGVVGTWVYKPNDGGPKLEAGWDARAGSTSGEAPPPRPTSPSRRSATSRGRHDDPPTPRPVGPRGDLVRFPGGPCDPDRRSPAAPARVRHRQARRRPPIELAARSSARSRSRKGRYPLSKPLDPRPKPVRLVGEPGSIDHGSPRAGATNPLDGRDQDPLGRDDPGGIRRPLRRVGPLGPRGRLRRPPWSAPPTTATAAIRTDPKFADHPGPARPPRVRPRRLGLGGGRRT